MHISAKSAKLTPCQTIFWRMRVDKLTRPSSPFARPPSCGLPVLDLPRMSLGRVGPYSKVWMLSVTFRTPDANTSS
jgi:hypothetical protein